MNKKSFFVNIILFIALLAGLFKFIPHALAGNPNFNPPYPRIGQIYFYNAGAGPDIWAGHDMVGIRHYKDDFARRIKEKNPDILLLAANDAIEGVPIENRTGQKLPEEWYLHYTTGERIAIWGGYLVNQPNPDFRQHMIDFLEDYTDWQYFDGHYFDSWISGLGWMIDMSKSPISSADWEASNQALIREMRAQTSKPIIAHEAPDQNYSNGNAFEFWSQVEDPVSGHRGNMGWAAGLQKQATEPVIIYANSEAPGISPLFRADFASSQIAGAFFGHDEGTFAHRWTFLHDEYEANLGYPTSGPQQLESGLWIRYFDNGVVIANLTGEPKTVTAGQLKNGPYYRFKGNQDPNFNNGQIVDANSPVVLNGTYDSREAGRVTIDGIMLFKEPTTLVTPIIIDNISINMTTVGQQPASYSGSWSQVSGATDTQTAYYLGVEWGNNAEPYAITTGSGTATYQPQINVGGPYEVYEWHPDTKADGQGTGCSNVQISIGSDTKTINQQTNAGQWNSLGTYNFTNSATVTLTAPGGCTAASDAIRWVWRGKGSEPTSPPPAKKGDLNNDGNIDIFDYNILVENFGNASCGNIADIDRNCRVDIFDYNIIIENFGK